MELVPVGGVWEYKSPQVFDGPGRQGGGRSAAIDGGVGLFAEVVRELDRDSQEGRGPERKAGQGWGKVDEGPGMGAGEAVRRGGRVRACQVEGREG